MSIQHQNIPDGLRHEPKGISSATANTIYVSNGAGSGVWKLVPVEGLSAGTNIKGLNLETNGTGGYTLKPFLTKLSSTAQTFSAVPANSSAEVNIAVPGILTTDEIVQLIKAAPQSGLVVNHARVTANGQVTIQFINVTSAAITPTANEVYGVYFRRA